MPPPPEGDWWTGSLEEAGPGLCGRYLQRKPKRQRAPNLRKGTQIPYEALHKLQ